MRSIRLTLGGQPPLFLGIRAPKLRALDRDDYPSFRSFSLRKKVFRLLLSLPDIQLVIFTEYFLFEIFDGEIRPIDRSVSRKEEKKEEEENKRRKKKRVGRDSAIRQSAVRRKPGMWVKFEITIRYRTEPPLSLPLSLSVCASALVVVFVFTLTSSSPFLIFSSNRMQFLPNRFENSALAIYIRDHRSKSYSTLWNDSKGLERIEFQRSFGEQFVERRSSTRGSRCNKTAKRVEKQGRTTVTDEREQQQKEEGGRARYRGRPFSRLLAPRPK